MEMESIHNIRRFVPPQEYIESESCCKEDCQKSEGLKKCSGCKYAKYCSRECQKQAWANHKQSCKLLGRRLEEMRTSATRSVPFCAICSEMTLMCKCKNLDSDAILVSISNVPPSYEEKQRRFRKWVKKCSEVNPNFDANQFYEKLIAEDIITGFEIIGDTLQQLMQRYVKNKAWQKNVDVKKISNSDVCANLVVALSKLSDFSFCELTVFELTLLRHMLSTHTPKIMKNRVVERISNLVSGLLEAAINTENWQYDSTNGKFVDMSKY
eukprot:Phypoly_transcript_13196.p1 GENE.Phypoly_transcript_13196~~Phypoly_transcript_13196.p1  ORF type:complete len:268 (+),score=35.33 Phypoly_transcript_13196:70-873(+)